MGKMIKADLVAIAASAAPAVKQRDVVTIIEVVLEEIGELAEGCCMELRGLGTFERKRQTMRGKHNPKTLEPAPEKTYSTIRFKPSKMLRRD